MQDSEEHPSRRLSPQHNGHQNGYLEDAVEADYGADSSDSTVADASLLPSHGLLKALLIGAGAGVFTVLLNVVLTFINTPIFQQARSAGNNITYNTALAVFELQCLNFLVSLLICFAAGFLVGKFAVQRRLGFYAGALVAAITYLASFVVRYIPNYPAANQATQVVNILIFLVVWALIGGLIGLWGARMATGKHPYYQRRAE